MSEKKAKKNQFNFKLPKFKRKKRMVKRKVRWWQILILAILVAIASFLIYIFVATSGDDEPIYGDRCASLVSIDNSALKKVVSTYKEEDSIKKISVDVECREIQVTITFVSGSISASDAETLTTQLLHDIDDSQGYDVPDGSSWSELFGVNDDSVGQYDAAIVLYSSGDDSGFPIFGTKHTTQEDISWTGPDPVNQDTTNEVTSQDD